MRNARWHLQHARVPEYADLRVTDKWHLDGRGHRYAAELAAEYFAQVAALHARAGEFAAVERIVKRMVDELLPKVREDKKRVRTMTVKIRYPEFVQESHGRSLTTATDLEGPFYPLVAPLLRAAWTQRRALRLVSVRFSNVEDGDGQLEMFAEVDEKRRRLAGVLDRLNEGGRQAVVQHGHQLAPGSKSP